MAAAAAKLATTRLGKVGDLKNVVQSLGPKSEAAKEMMQKELAAKGIKMPNVAGIASNLPGIASSGFMNGNEPVSAEPFAKTEGDLELEDIRNTLNQRVKDMSDETILEIMFRSYVDVDRPPMSHIGVPTLLRAYDTITKQLFDVYKNDFVFTNHILCQILNEPIIKKIFYDIILACRKKRYIMEVPPDTCNCTPEEALYKHRDSLAFIQARYFADLLKQFRIKLIQELRPATTDKQTPVPRRLNLFPGTVPVVKGGHGETPAEKPFDGQTFDEADTDNDTVKKYVGHQFLVSIIDEPFFLQKILTDIVKIFLRDEDPYVDIEKNVPSKVMQSIIVDDELHRTTQAIFLKMSETFYNMHNDIRIKQMILLNLLQESRCVTALFHYVRSGYPERACDCNNDLIVQPYRQTYEQKGGEGGEEGKEGDKPTPLTYQQMETMISTPMSDNQNDNQFWDQNGEKLGRLEKVERIKSITDPTRWVYRYHFRQKPFHRYLRTRQGKLSGTESVNELSDQPFYNAPVKRNYASERTTKRVASGIGVIAEAARCTTEKVDALLLNVLNTLLQRVEKLSNEKLVDKLLPTFDRLYKDSNKPEQREKNKFDFPAVATCMDTYVRTLMNRCYQDNVVLLRFVFCQLLNDSEIRADAKQAKKEVEDMFRTVKKLNNDCEDCRIPENINKKTRKNTAQLTAVDKPPESRIFQEKFLLFFQDAMQKYAAKNADGFEVHQKAGAKDEADTKGPPDTKVGINPIHQNVASSAGILRYVASELKSKADKNRPRFIQAMMTAVQRATRSNYMYEKLGFIRGNGDGDEVKLLDEIKKVMVIIKNNYNNVDLTSKTSDTHSQQIKRTMILHLLRDNRCKHFFADCTLKQNYPEKEAIFMEEDEMLKMQNVMHDRIQKISGGGGGRKKTKKRIQSRR